MRTLAGSLVLPAFLIVYTLFFLGTVDGRLEGDDHFALAHAAALVEGDRLNIELFDPGTPLQTLVSYVGQRIGGSRTISEILIALAIRLIGLTAIYLLTWTLVRSRMAAVAVAAAVALLLLHEAVYGAEKIALYPVAILAAWKYLEGRLSVYWLSGVVATAALWRHDHGVYVGVALALAVCLRPRPIPSLLRLAAGVLVLLAPWLIWVQATEGIPSYIASRIAFAQDNGLGRDRPFGFVLPFVWSSSAPRILWHLAALTTIAALILSIRRRSIPVIVLAGMSLVAAIGLMRKEGQAGEVAALWIPLFAWMLRELPWFGRAVLVCIGIVGVAAVITVTQATEELPQIAFGGGGLMARARSAVRFHMTTPPIDAYAPYDEEETSDGRLVIRYLWDCLEPGDRVWETAMWFPVAYYTQRRPVWHLHWDHGLKHDERSEQQFLEWIRQQSAPVIITHSSGDPLEPFRWYPRIRQYVMANYREITSARFEEYRAKGNKLRLLADSRRAPAGRYAALDLPCFR